MKYIGYHRTSTAEQHLERGVEEIKRFCKDQGIELYKGKVYTDQKTGKNFERPAYLIVKEELLEPGDVLIISELDRLGRNKPETLKELQYFKQNNIRVMILEIPTTLSDIRAMEDSLAKMVLEMIDNLLVEIYATIAQAEMEKREKRQREGIEQMKARGDWAKYGRPRAIELDVFGKAYERVLKNEIRPFQLIEELKLTTPTYYKYKKLYEEKNNIRRKGRVQMNSYLVCDTTEEERRELVNIAFGFAKMGGTGPNPEVMRMAEEYISGRMEISALQKVIDGVKEMTRKE